MQKKIVVFGATGNLGGKIIDSLLTKEVKVIAIVRIKTDPTKIKKLVGKGVEVFTVDMASRRDMAKVCVGAHCVVSALAGLGETVIDTQKVIVDAAIKAGVKRFIPSDYSIDFTNLKPGENRNLDLRREFHSYLEKIPIKVTTIFNGAFMDLLTTEMPLILFKQKRIFCWGNPDQKLDFTTTYNVAEYTAAAAIDDDTPRFLRIAGDSLSCKEFVKLLTNMTGEKYKLFRPGGIGLLNAVIKITKFFSPAKDELYPAWQGMQYMRDMMEGRVEIKKYSNDSYPDIKWTSVNEFLGLEKFSKNV